MYVDKPYCYNTIHNVCDVIINGYIMFMLQGLGIVEYILERAGCHAFLVMIMY